MPTRHINRFLRRNNRLRPILVRIDRDRRILESIRDALPGDLKNHCIHATAEDGDLIVYTTSPVWATRLRFVAPDLVRAIPKLPPSTRVTVRIASTPEAGRRIQTPRQNGPSLSSGARQHLLEAADGLTDPTLAAAFRRLARGNVQTKK